MIDRLLHTPDGVRDTLNDECQKKQSLERELHKVLVSFGYRDLETPTFEFFDVFGREVGTTPSQELYKFFDREGNTLVLRPDFTPSIARAASKYFREEDKAVRLCYQGNTFINGGNYQGHLKETTQMGAELLGDESPEADAELIAMSVELLKKAGLQEFQVSVGHVGFFKSLMKEAGFSEEDEAKIRSLITMKNFFGVEEFLESFSLNEKLKKALITLPEMFGSSEVLDRAESLTDNEEALAAVKRLKEIYELLKIYGVEKYISFDFGMLNKYQYYTGVIFQAYTYGTGEPIVKGGRYDNLLARFGKDFAATGFAVVIDQLMSALSRQKIAIPVEADGRLVLYDASSRDAAIHLAVSMRKDGRPVELVRKTAGETAEDYRDFAAENGHGKIYDLTAEGVKEADV